MAMKLLQKSCIMSRMHWYSREYIAGGKDMGSNTLDGSMEVRRC